MGGTSLLMGKEKSSHPAEALQRAFSRLKDSHVSTSQAELLLPISTLAIGGLTTSRTLGEPAQELSGRRTGPRRIRLLGPCRGLVFVHGRRRLPQQHSVDFA
jgi:hypothetical protein